MTQQNDSYFIYLSSNKSINNDLISSSDFFNSLYTKLDLQAELYEVALCEVWYKPIDKFFGFSPGDNIINVSEGGSVTSLNIEEPSSHNIVDLVTQINFALMREGKNGVEFSTAANKIFVNCGASTVTVSERLANLLGLENITLSGDDIEIENINLFKDNTLYLVHCDIISPQLFSNQYKQILRVFGQPHKTVEIQNTSFQPLQYLNVTSPSIDKIHIWITNESGSKVEFDVDSGFTCLLHLRNKTL
jgi:hypothetical protein